MDRTTKGDHQPRTNAPHTVSNAQQPAVPATPPAEQTATETCRRDHPSLAALVGQHQAVTQLTALVEFAKSRGESLPHMLFIGPSGIGKRTFAGVLANELKVSLVSTSGTAAVERSGDLLGILTNLNDGDVLFIDEIHRLARVVEELLYAAMEDFAVNLVMDKGIHARSIKHRLNRFTVIGTAQRKEDVSERLRRALSIQIAFGRYSENDLATIAQEMARQQKLVLTYDAALVVARLADGNPSRLKDFLRFLSHDREVTEQEATTVFRRLGFLRPAPPASEPDADLMALSGIDFERLITGLLTRMGFRTELTSVTGDGGIDIVAHLDRPIVGGRYLVQCKRYAADTPVGAQLVREFYGAVAKDQQALKGLFITTSTFTPQAREFAAEVRMELIGGTEVRKLLTDESQRNLEELR